MPRADVIILLFVSEFATRVWLRDMRCVTAKGKCAVLVWQYTAGRYAEFCALSSCATGRYSVSLSLRERWHVIRDGEGNSVTISYVTTLIFYHFSTLLST